MLDRKLNLGFVLIVCFFATVLTIAGCSGGGGTDSGAHNPYPDTDGDGINNGNDGDVDGDGIPNDLDKDNDNAPGPIGDPSVPCTTTKIYWPNDEVIAGNSADLRWELQPKGCALSSAQNKSIKATAKSGSLSVASVAKKTGQLITTIRVPCNSGYGSNPRAIVYDFTELGNALGDTLGGYKHNITHPGPAKGCSGDDGDSGGDSGKTQCFDFSGTNGGTYPNCTCQNKDYTFEGDACVAPTYCKSAKINWPSNNSICGTGSPVITWNLLPSGCTLKQNAWVALIGKADGDVGGSLNYRRHLCGRTDSKTFYDYTLEGPYPTDVAIGDLRAVCPKPGRSGWGLHMDFTSIRDALGDFNSGYKKSLYCQ